MGGTAAATLLVLLVLLVQPTGPLSHQPKAALAAGSTCNNGTTNGFTVEAPSFGLVPGATPANVLFATVGQTISFSVKLRDGVDQPAAGYTASVDWGDGTGADTAPITFDNNGNCSISASHAYTKVGHKLLIVSVNSPDRRTTSVGVVAAIAPEPSPFNKPMIGVVTSSSADGSAQCTATVVRSAGLPSYITANPDIVLGDVVVTAKHCGLNNNIAFAPGHTGINPRYTDDYQFNYAVGASGGVVSGDSPYAGDTIGTSPYGVWRSSLPPITPFTNPNSADIEFLVMNMPPPELPAGETLEQEVGGIQLQQPTRPSNATFNVIGYDVLWIDAPLPFIGEPMAPDQVCVPTNLGPCAFARSKYPLGDEGPHVCMDAPALNNGTGYVTEPDGSGGLAASDCHLSTFASGAPIMNATMSAIFAITHGGDETNPCCVVYGSFFDDTATITDIQNPDTYACSQPGFVDFESFPDGTNLSSGTISGMQFTTTDGFTWRVGDFSTGRYNGKYPSGAYTSHGTHWAWLGTSQGRGRIDFPGGAASHFSLLVSDATPVSVDAYNQGGALLATAGPSPSNYGTGHMTELQITRATPDMDHVIVHDSGNFFEIDDVCTNSPGTPNTIKRIVDQTFFMQSGQQASGRFIVDFVTGAKQFLHILLGPFFSDVNLNLTRPDGSPVSPTDPGVTYNKSTNSIEVSIDGAASGSWQYQIIANQLDPGGENIHIAVDEETILTNNAPPTLTIPGDQTVQYSDALTVGMSCADPESTDVLTLSTSGLPSALTFTDNGNGTGTVSGTAQVAAGTYPVTFTCNDGFNPSVTGGLNIVVTREDAVVTPSSTNPTAVKVNSPGGTAGPIVLTANITEATDDKTNGNISLAAPVTYQLVPVGAGSTYTCAAGTSGGGVGGTLGTTCTFNNAAVNVYEVHFSIGGNYYQGSADTVLAVYDSSLGFVTGGGTIMHNGVIANFGFGAKYLKSGQIQGSLLYIEHRSGGDVIVKSNAMGSLSIVSNTAYILGKATLNGVGNYKFRTTVVDNGELGSTDQIGLQVQDPSNATVSDLTFSPMTLTGGNIQVPHR